MQHWLSCPSGQCCASDIISKWSVSELPAEAPKFGANIGELLRLSASGGQSCKVSSNLIHSLCSSGLRLCSLRSSRRDVRDTDRCKVALDGLFARPSSTLRSSSMRRCWPQHFEVAEMTDFLFQVRHNGLSFALANMMATTVFLCSVHLQSRPST